MSRRIWKVPTPDSPCIVVAETAEDARELVIDYLHLCEDKEVDLGSPADVTGQGSPRRTVAFDSAEDAEDLIRELERAGVNLSHVRRRYSVTALGESPLWEVAVLDLDWCRLPAQVLSGGAE